MFPEMTGPPPSGPPSGLTDIVHHPSTQLHPLLLQSTPFINPDIINNTSEGVGVKNRSAVNMVDGCAVMDIQFEFLPWDNPDNVMSQDALYTAYKMFGVLTFPLAAMGVVLNVLNGVVYARLGLKDRINLLLFSLALADLVACVYFALHSANSLQALLVGGTPVTGPLMIAMTQSGALLLLGATYVSGFVSTLIACERCLCILKPFKAKTLFKTSTTALAVLTATVLLFVLHYFISEKYKIRCVFIPALGRTLSVAAPSEFYTKNSGFVDVLNVIVFGILLPAFFVLTTALATVTTAVQLRRAVAWRQSSTTTTTTTTTSKSATSKSSSTADSREVALTRMLVAVSCLFIACTVPNIVIRTAPLFVEELRMGGRHQNMILLLAGVIHVVGAVNSSLNFFVYYRMGSRFRETLRRTVCGGVRRGRGGKAVLGDSEGVTSITMATTDTA